MSATAELFREDSYAKQCKAQVVAINDRGGIILDRSVFYPAGGGQPGDAGMLTGDNGAHWAIATTVYDDARSIVHVPDNPEIMPSVGDKVVCDLDWTRRYAHMRVHTALHLLCAVLPYPVTGGSISEGDGRLDFDIPEAGLDKDALTDELNNLVERDMKIDIRWITDEELAAQPELVRTMAVKPPMGTGKVRLIAIGDVDLQPCGGTHVSRTSEIGPVTVTKIEKKGAQNRRVRLSLQ